MSEYPVDTKNSSVYGIRWLCLILLRLTVNERCSLGLHWHFALWLTILILSQWLLLSGTRMMIMVADDERSSVTLIMSLLNHATDRTGISLE